VCRAQNGECDVAEVCGGDSPDCPTDLFVAAGEHCGGLPNGDCDAQNTCDGAGTCTENYLGAETVCRAANGECDVAEVCGGDSPNCPTDLFVAAGEHCGGLPNGDCDAQNTCDGAGGCTENYLGAETVCRASLHDCDAEEVCPGDSKLCPDDLMEPIDTPCGDPTDDVCNKPDTCDGAGFCRANLEPITTECRAATGDCDVAEFCDGLGNCPDDGVVEYGWECRAAGGDCEAAAVCDGASKACPANEFLLPGEHCGGLPVGDCDAQNTCDGAGVCTVNFQPDDYECRGAAGDCDLPAFCTGSAVDCPPNGLKPSTEMCRAAEGDCDVAEYCTGNDVDCPADVFVAPNEPCGDTTTNTACDKPDTCDGAGVCQSNYTDAGVLCATHQYDEYRCFEEDMCGAEAQELVRNSYCDGAGACDEADDDEWVALETCDAVGQICEADEFGARCLDCDDSWADDDICLDEATVRSWFGDGECDANQCVNYDYVDTPCGVGEHCVDGACEALPTCSGQEYGGHCWFLADLNQSCDAACAAQGLAYDDATRTFAGVSAVRNYANKANCLALVKLFKPSVSVIRESGWDGGAVGCTWWNSGEAYINAEAITNSSATRAYHGRICACQ